MQTRQETEHEDDRSHTASSDEPGPQRARGQLRIPVDAFDSTGDIVLQFLAKLD